MPKKSAARSGAQRNKPRVQKSIELVRQKANVEQKAASIEDQEVETEIEAEATDEVVADGGTSTVTSPDTSSSEEGTKRRRSRNTVTTASTTRTAPQSTLKRTPTAASEEEETASPTTSTTNHASTGSAASRLAARRQNAQRVQQRAAPTLITSQHYIYVRRELITIAILAFIMFSVIIILHFVPGIGS